MLSERMKKLDSSGIRKIFELGVSMKNPIDFSLGQPDFDVPEPVKKAAIEAIKAGRNHYTVTGGIPELKSAVEETLKKEGVEVEEVLATAGASGGLVLALFTLADHSTEVLITDPGFVTYGHIAHMANAHVKRISTYPDFRLTPKKLEEAVKKSSNGSFKSHILLFNSPVNPTGVAYTKEEIKGLAETAKKLNLQVISDEVYDHFCYDFSHECWLKHDPKAVLVRTFGKSWGMTGWRAGFAAGPKKVIEQMTMLQQFSFVCVNTPSQWASVEALKFDVSEIIERYRIKRDYVYSALSQAFKVNKPGGAFYIFPEAPGGDMGSFFKKCIEKEILVVPGQAFSRLNTHFRVSYACDDEKMKRGIDMLVKLASAQLA